MGRQQTFQWACLRSEEIGLWELKDVWVFEPLGPSVSASDQNPLSILGGGKGFMQMGF